MNNYGWKDVCSHLLPTAKNNNRDSKTVFAYVVSIFIILFFCIAELASTNDATRVIRTTSQIDLTLTLTKTKISNRNGSVLKILP